MNRVPMWTSFHLLSSFGTFVIAEVVEMIGCIGLVSWVAKCCDQVSAKDKFFNINNSRKDCDVLW